MELGPIQKKWVEALRSGKYKQANGYLRDNEDCFCCLGVACDVLGLEPVLDGNLYLYNNDDQALDEKIFVKLGLFGSTGDPNGKLEWNEEEDEFFAPLSELNDCGSSFNEIADLLETHPEVYFKESL